MFWSNFLHFYQPPNQQKDILERIVNESYRPLMRIFRDNPQAKATININGGLLELLEENGYQDVISDINELLKRGQIELTGSAKYHAFLPLLSENEVRRQIEINEESLRKYFGGGESASSARGGFGGWVKKGFFPPELAYDFNLARIVKEMGYEWIVAAQIAYPPRTRLWRVTDGSEIPKFDRAYKIKGLGDFKIFFRHKQASVLILSGITRSVDSFFSELGLINTNSVVEKTSEVSLAPLARGNSSTSEVKGVIADSFYLLTIMDAETFGHHRPGLQDLLFEFYKKGEGFLEPVLVSDLPKYFPEGFREVEPRASTWSNEEQDFWLDKERKVAAKNPFLLWKDPNNPIHKLQWEFTEWVIGLVCRLSTASAAANSPTSEVDKETSEIFLDGGTARVLLDRALSSDMFWWASAKPWWSLEMIEAGAYELKKVVEAIPRISKENQQRAGEYYHKILAQAFDWQRTGKIRQAHREAQGGWKDIPFKVRAPAEWYNQIILEFEDEMKKSVQNLEYEKAIKWRDAVIKLKEGTDVYDVLHVVDELHSVRKIPSVKPFLEHKPEEFSEFAKEHLAK